MLQSNRDKRGPDVPLGWYADYSLPYLTLIYFVCVLLACTGYPAEF